MTRAFIAVLDSLGIGSAPDAQAFGDAGANTLGHIARWRAQSGHPLRIPSLESLGLGAAAKLATGEWPAALAQRDGFAGSYAAACERSKGKDTPSGHWEMCGVPVDFDWGYFPAASPCFPSDFMSEWLRRCRLGGSLGNCHASGSEVLKTFGDAHIASGHPIVYTSADSVFQVAVHEEHFGVQRLYEICEVAFELLRPWDIARVIARPFIGRGGEFVRTGNRRDFAVEPPAMTLLDVACAKGREVISIGKIGDIFSRRGITREYKATGNSALMDCFVDVAKAAPDGALAMVNFVDFDQNFGHRRDVGGYADALEALDIRMPELLAQLREGDLLVLTADHGCDPSWAGTDHTREHVPQLFYQPGHAGVSLGVRESFCDLGQTVAAHLGLPALDHGRSLL